MNLEEFTGVLIDLLRDNVSTARLSTEYELITVGDCVVDIPVGGMPTQLQSALGIEWVIDAQISVYMKSKLEAFQLADTLLRSIFSWDIQCERRCSGPMMRFWEDTGMYEYSLLFNFRFFDGV